jgi:hypothetical protein
MRGNKRRKSETTWSYLAFPLVPRPNDFLNLTTNSRMQGSAVHPYIATYQSKILGLLDAFQKWNPQGETKEKQWNNLDIVGLSIDTYPGKDFLKFNTSSRTQ